MKKLISFIQKSRFAVMVIFISLLLLNACQRSQYGDYGATADDFPLLEMSIVDLQKKYEDGSMTIQEVVQMYLNRIEWIDRSGHELRSVLWINPDALEIAIALDEELRQGKKRGPLHGIPIMLKDNMNTLDSMPTTAGSRALENSFPGADSFVAHQLREAGAVILGKTNLSEWANFRGQMSSSGWSGLGGQTKNPYFTDRNPCGSSSGSGVAVSANLTMVAIGTETNGSVVCPSHANGIVGIKPTVGFTGRTGIIPISFHLDNAGPMARSVQDAAITLGIMAGEDPNDSLTLGNSEKRTRDYTPWLDKGALKGKRIGFFTSPMGANFKVDSLFNNRIEWIKSMGAEIVKISNISAPQTSQHAFQVMLYEYKDGLNKYFASLGPDAPVKSLEELIAFNRNDSITLRWFDQRYLEMAQEKGDLDSPEYLEALAEMHEGSRTNGIDRVLSEHDLDAIIAPTGSPAWKTDHINGDSFQLGSSSPAAHAGYPIITLPVGDIDGLPVGMSVFGTAWSEPVLISIAYAIEQGLQARIVPQFRSEIESVVAQEVE